MYDRQVATQEEEVHAFLRSAIARSADLGRGGARDLAVIPLGPLPQFGESQSLPPARSGR